MAAEPFSVITVPDDAVDQIELMGTKPKFWFDHPTLGKCLYKEARPQTGEDWAEKVAAELAEQIGLPHAQFELAQWRDTLGTVSPSFVRRGHDLVHGNELLFWVDPSYPTRQGDAERFYKMTAHTLDAVLGGVAGGRCRARLDTAERHSTRR